MPAFVYSMPVRFADIDHAGIVYYPRFFDYFHQTFEQWWIAKKGPRAYADLLNRDRIGLPAVSAHCEYRSPLRFGDTATVTMGITRLSKRSATFRYLVHRAADASLQSSSAVLCAEGTVTCVIVDLQRFVAINPPMSVLEFLEELKVADETEKPTDRPGRSTCHGRGP